MQKNEILEKTNKYLNENNSDKDLVRFAKELGIEVGNGDLSLEYIAITIINSDTKVIIINPERVVCPQENKFVVAYQLAEYIKTPTASKKFVLFFTIDSLDLETYQLTKQIYEKSLENKNEYEQPLSKVLAKNISRNLFLTRRK